jgi:hypothetical protein
MIKAMPSNAMAPPITSKTFAFNGFAHQKQFDFMSGFLCRY